MDAEGKAASFTNAVVVFTTTFRHDSGCQQQPADVPPPPAAEPMIQVENVPASGSDIHATVAAATLPLGPPIPAKSSPRSSSPSPAILSELLTAVDAVVPFVRLSPEATRAVVSMHLSHLRDHLVDASLAGGLTWDDDVVDSLAVRVMAQQTGAGGDGLRPLAGMIKREVLGRIAHLRLAARSSSSHDDELGQKVEGRSYHAHLDRTARRISVT